MLCLQSVLTRLRGSPACRVEAHQVLTSPQLASLSAEEQLVDTEVLLQHLAPNMFWCECNTFIAVFNIYIFPCVYWVLWA